MKSKIKANYKILLIALGIILAIVLGIISNYNRKNATVYYKTYTANADHTVTAIDEVKTSTTAASYDSDRKIFSIMLSGNDGRFLQNCVYDVDIELS